MKAGFKNGVFASSANMAMTTVRLLDVLLASHLITEQDKARYFRPWRTQMREMSSFNIKAMAPSHFYSKLVSLELFNLQAFNTRNACIHPHLRELEELISIGKDGFTDGQIHQYEELLKKIEWDGRAEGLAITRRLAESAEGEEEQRIWLQAFEYFARDPGGFSCCYNPSKSSPGSDEVEEEGQIDADGGSFSEDFGKNLRGLGL